MSFNPRCPFHTAALTTAVLASCSYAYFYLTKSKAMKRFDIDNRFTDSISYNNMVFISGQVGEGETIEEQTISALKSVDAALSKVSISISYFSYLLLSFYFSSSCLFCIHVS
jgi:enamine deaminase RidA (YjgF/YER057c/UK114 family)